MNMRLFYIKYSIWAALLFSVTATLFLFLNTYSDMWLLYVGNLLFSAVVLTGVIRVNHLVKDNAGIQFMTMAGLKITFYGLLIASVITLTGLFISSMVFSQSATLTESPSQAGADPRGDLVFSLFMSAVLLNATLGALAAVIGAAVAKRNQKTTEGKTL